MGMLERVAMAIFEADGMKHAAPNVSLQESWGMSARYHEEYLRRARAAIGAMRDPTEAMVDAGFDYDERNDQLEIGRALTPEECQAGEYRAMIDAALRE